MHPLAYLLLQSTANSVRASLRRLRQPRYALGAAAMAAYLWFFILQPQAGDLRATRDPFSDLASALPGELAAGGLFLAAALRWVFAGHGAPLSFSEAEVAWLFPAPLSQRTLLHFHLAKSALRSLWMALVFAAIARGAGEFGPRFVGLTLLLSAVSLHGLAGAFTRERWRLRGVTQRQRAVAISLLVAALFAATWLRGGASELAASGGFFEALPVALASAPLSWALEPLRWLTAPLAASPGAELLWAALPALALLAVLYAWVRLAAVDFREDTAANAVKLTARVEAVRSGRSVFAARERKARREPFALAPRGRAELAFLWQRLISFGPWSYPRALTAAILAGVAGAFAFTRSGAAADARFALIILPSIFAIQGGLLGAAMLRNALALPFERLDSLRAMPLRGSQIVLGALLGPALLIAAFEVLMLSLIALGSSAGAEAPASSLVWSAFGAALLVLTPVVLLGCGTQLALQIAFPAWFAPAAQRPGFETGGLNMLLLFVPLLALSVALIPAAISAALFGGLVHFATNALAPSVIVGGISATAVTSGEVALLVAWLGRRYERLDLASDFRA